MKRETVPKGFHCECGKFHRFTPYVSAHAEIDLTHHCNNCNRRHTIRDYTATLESEDDQ